MYHFWYIRDQRSWFSESYRPAGACSKNGTTGTKGRDSQKVTGTKGLKVWLNCRPKLFFTCWTFCSYGNLVGHFPVDHFPVDHFIATRTYVHTYIRKVRKKANPWKYANSDKLVISEMKNELISRFATAWNFSTNTFEVLFQVFI